MRWPNFLAAVGLGALAMAMAQKFFVPPPTAITSPALLFYGPAPNFAQKDVELIDKAHKTIDMAAYVLSERDIIAALSEAASRGVTVRLYFDPEQFKRVGARNDDLMALVSQPHVSARLKSEQDDLMHLKSFAVDGRILRSGSANFSWSGLTRQDNDIVIFDDPAAAAAFTAHFDALWARPGNKSLP